MSFSNWSSLSQEKRIHWIEESLEEIQEGHMPPGDYKLLHPEAAVSKAELDALKAYLGGNEAAFHEQHEESDDEDE